MRSDGTVVPNERNEEGPGKGAATTPGSLAFARDDRVVAFRMTVLLRSGWQNPPRNDDGLSSRMTRGLFCHPERPTGGGILHWMRHEARSLAFARDDRSRLIATSSPCWEGHGNAQVPNKMALPSSPDHYRLTYFVFFPAPTFSTTRFFTISARTASTVVGLISGRT